MPRKYDSKESKRRILSACVRLFIQKGYHSTTLAEILKEADVTNSTFQNIFHTKNGVLLNLTEFMFDSQFAAARNVGKKELPPVYIYAAETAIQLTLTELYSIFSPYNPALSESDFYELEIGTSGIMRNYMARPCDKYFTLDRKLARFLGMSLAAYNVPKDEIKEVTDSVLSIVIKNVANDIMKKLFEALAMRFEFELGENTVN